MAQLQWQFDAPSGTYKQHELSRKLYEQAVAESVFMDHVAPIESFGRKMGENVTLTRLATLTEPTSVTLTEGERIPEDQWSITTTSITVVEIGRAVPYTSLVNDLSFFDLESPIQRALKDQMKLALDTKCATAYKTAKVKYIPTGLATGTFDTDGTASTTASANLNVFHLEEIADYMYDTLLTPPIGDEYIAICRNLALRGIKRDPSWEEWHKYTDPEAKYNGEVGMIENVRFIKTNHNNALGKVGTSSVLGSCVFFGQDSVAMAEVLTPELRAAQPADFGRSKAVAWYGILEFGIIWDTANAGQARIVHVTSA